MTSSIGSSGACPVYANIPTAGGQNTKEPAVATKPEAVSPPSASVQDGFDKLMSRYIAAIDCAARGYQGGNALVASRYEDLVRFVEAHPENPELAKELPRKHIPLSYFYK